MKLGIIGAMGEEVAILKDRMNQVEEKTTANCHFFTGQINEVDVVLLQSGIGKVNAAMATTLLIEKYHPDYMINTGSAGGFDQSLNVGDIVISTEVRHHDVDVTAFDYEYGQVPGLPPAYKADSFLQEIANKAATMVTDVQVVSGLIATGDSFMSDARRVEEIKERFLGLQAAEMEAAAIAQVCHQFGSPFVVIRALSDIAGKDANVSFDQFLETAARNSAELILSMVKELSVHA